MEFTKCYFGTVGHNVTEHMEPYTFCGVERHLPPC